MNIKYPVNTTFLDYPDNESLAVLLYIMGCDNYCIGCHNPNFQDKYYTDGTRLESHYFVAQKLIDLCVLNKTNKIVISGGDCLYEENFSETRNLLSELNFYTLCSELSSNNPLSLEICLYTGKDIDYVKGLNLPKVTFIKCGKYEKDLKQEIIKNDDYMQFSSSNQKLYDGNYKLLSKDGKYFFKNKKEVK